jgi:hypothetical protein
MSRTEQDDVPPTDVLVAAEEREKKETEDLLAGFDRPARDPRRRANGSFASYYAGPREEATTPDPPGAGPAPVSTPALTSDAGATRVLPKGPTTKDVLLIALALVVAALIGTVALLFTLRRSPAPAAAASSVTSAAPAATTAAPPASTLPPDAWSAATAPHDHPLGLGPATTATTTATTHKAAAPPQNPSAKPRTDVSRHFD